MIFIYDKQSKDYYHQWRILNNDEGDNTLSRFRKFLHFFVNWLSLNVPFLFILLLGIIMNTFLGFRNPNFGIAGGDSFGYLIPIHNFFAGKGYTLNGITELHFPPGFGIIGYIFFLIFRSIEMSGMIVSSISYLFVIILTYMIVNLLKDKKTALLASFFVTFCPVLIYYSIIPLSELLFTLFLLLICLILIKIVFDGFTIFRLGLLGFLLGYAFLIRPEGFLIAGLTYIGLMVISLFKKSFISNSGYHFKILNRLLYPQITLLIFLLVSLPYLYFLYCHTGHWSISGKIAGVFIRGGVKAVPDNPAALDYLKKMNSDSLKPGARLDVIDYVKSNGMRFFLKRIANNAENAFTELLNINFHAVISLLLVVFIFLVIKGRTIFNFFKMRKKLLFIFAVLLSVLPVYLFFHIKMRYLVPYSVIILIIIAIIIGDISIILFRNKKHQYFSFALIYLISFLVLINLPDHSRQFPFHQTLSSILTYEHPNLGLRGAGLWLKKNVNDIDSLKIILPDRGFICLFYAGWMGGKKNQGKEFDIDKDMDISAVYKIMRENQIDYLILDKTDISKTPKLLVLWNEPEIAERYKLKLMHKDVQNMFQIYSPMN